MFRLHLASPDWQLRILKTLSYDLPNTHRLRSASALVHVAGAVHCAYCYTPSMAVALLSSSRNHQPLQHCPSLRSHLHRIDQLSRGFVYPLDARLKHSRPSHLLTLDAGVRTFIERCHLSLRFHSNSHCLKHGQAGEASSRSAIRAHAKNSNHCHSDAESADWINNALRDPMVEVDPVTICHQILAEKQSRPLEISTTVVESTPRASQERLIRLGHVAVATVIAVFLLAVVGILQFLRFRKTGERGQLKKGAALSTSTSEALNTEADSMIETNGAPHDVLSSMSAAMVGNAVVEEDRIVGNVENFQSEREDVSLKEKPVYIWAEQSNFRNGSLAEVETEQTYSERWNIEDGTVATEGLIDSTEGLLDQTEGDGSMDESPSETVLASAILAQELSEMADSSSFSETTSQAGLDEDTKVMEEQRFREGSSHWNEDDHSMDHGLSSSQSGLADTAETVYTRQAQIQNGGIHATVTVSEEEKPPVGLHQEGTVSSFWSSSTAASSHPDQGSTHYFSSYDLQTISNNIFQPPRPDELKVWDASEAELPPFESSETWNYKASEQDRETYNKVLEQALPALFVAVGTAGTLLGVTAGLQVVGFAAAARLISQDLFWAQSRDSFWRELRSITDRQKLQNFLLRRKIVKEN